MKHRRLNSAPIERARFGCSSCERVFSQAMKGGAPGGIRTPDPRLRRAATIWQGVSRWVRNCVIRRDSGRNRARRVAQRGTEFSEGKSEATGGGAASAKRLADTIRLGWPKFPKLDLWP